jgi:alpha-tubulin suppressor-like RCC1 family protein
MLQATSPAFPSLNLFAWGLGSYGRLGNSATTTRSSPVQIGTGSNWKMVSSGLYSSSAIDTDGKLWAWGRNNAGQLGLGDVVDRSSPVQVGALTDWSTVYQARYHCFARKTDGTLWAWGNNFFRRLGDVPYGNKSSPVQVGTYQGASLWKTAKGGDLISFGIKTNGTLWAWGRNSTFGELGLGIATNTTISVPTQIGTDTNWSDLAVAGYAAFARKTNGTIWGWGYDSSGRFWSMSGTGTTRSSPVQLGTDTDWTMIATPITPSASRWRIQTMAIKTNGTLWGWGGGNYGKLGTGDTTSRSSPVQIGTGTDWAYVYCGEDHTVAVKSNGSLWAWGRNQNGQLGLNDTTNRSSPVQVGTLTWSSSGNRVSASRHTLALKEPPITLFRLFAWGRNTYGQLGLENTTTPVSSPVQVGTLTDWSTVSAAPFGMSGALKTDGSLWSWGRNNTGQLGHGDTTNKSSPVQIGTGTNWSVVDMGYTPLALKTDGTLWAWGRNTNGSIGTGNTSPNSSPVQVGTNTDWAKISSNGSDSITIPFQISCAIKTNGTLWTWGNNSVGALGHGNTTYLSSPVQVGTDTNWAEVDGNGISTIARKTNNTIWSWGFNSYGQLGQGNTTGLSSPVQIGSGTDWASVNCSTSMFFHPHMVAVKTNGTLWTWGRNSFGQLGQGNTTNRSSPVQVGTDTDWEWAIAANRHTIAAKTNGTLWGWGLDNYGVFLDNTPTYQFSSPVQIGTLTTWSGLGNNRRFSADMHIMALLSV